MRKDFLNISYKLAHRVGITSLLNASVNFLWHPAIKKTYDSNAYFDSIHPDTTGPCIKKNNLNKSYDLQIIIPVYNSEEYIKQCIDSILKQKTGYSILLTLINDGSTDKSGDILRNYEDDERVVVINQKNQGQSSARNKGLENIVGEYLMFVDSDDMLSDNSIEILMNQARKSGVDMVVGNVQRIKRGVYCERTHIKNLFESSTVWAKLFKAEIWANRCFPTGNKCEDTIFPLFIEHEIKSYDIVDEIVYYYRCNPNGVSMSDVNNPNRLETLYVTRLALESAKKAGLEPNMNQYNLFLHQCCHNTQRIATLGNYMLDYLVYLEQRELRKKYFKGFRTAYNNKLMNLDLLLEEEDFKKYFLFCLSSR